MLDTEFHDYPCRDAVPAIEKTKYEIEVCYVTYSRQQSHNVKDQRDSGGDSATTRRISEEAVDAGSDLSAARSAVTWTLIKGLARARYAYSRTGGSAAAGDVLCDCVHRIEMEREGSI